MTIKRQLYNWVRPLLPRSWQRPWTSDSERPSIEFVSATRLTEAQFWRSSFLGRSVKRLLTDDSTRLSVAYENKTGLPNIYNAALQRSKADILVFLHDDVWLEDTALRKKIEQGLHQFDVIGVAGNKRITPDQPSWFFSGYQNDQLIRDDLKNLSGAIYHGSPGRSHLSTFGPSPATCKLLDGVFLAVNRKTLLEHKVKFDSIFSFDFYDLDLCRQANQNKLKIGTWPINITHQSAGNFGTERWKESLNLYLRKWGN